MEVEDLQRKKPLMSFWIRSEKEKYRK